MGTLATLRDQADGGDEPQATASPRVSAAPNYYCLDNKHGPRLLTEDRFFYWDMNQSGCPVCPVCQKQVNAQMVTLNAKGQPQIPDGLLALASRIGEPV
jgi:hypothetical protein